MRIPIPLTSLARRAAVLWFASALFAAPTPVRASANEQAAPIPERSAQLDAERDRKATEVSAPRRTLVERGLYWYDNQYVLAKIFGGWKGLHLGGSSFPAGAGVKAAVGFTRQVGDATDPDGPNRFDLDAVAAYSTRGYSRIAVAWNGRRLGGAPFNARVSGQFYEYPQEDFFGLGQASEVQNRTNYLHNSTEASAALEWKPASWLALGGGVSYARPDIGSGTDSRFPSTEELFDPAALPAFTMQPDFVGADASVSFDWRDNPLHPHAGGRYAVQLSDIRDQDLDAFSFRRVTVDLQHYVPLPNRYRIVALRAAAVFTDPLEGQQVPFFYQPTLGGGQALRGFREFRFRDRNSLLLSAEYRWEASWMLDGALFVDAGQVAADRRELNLRDLDVSYGVGFRVHSNRAFVARLDLAFSREGFIPLLRFEHVF